MKPSAGAIAGALGGLAMLGFLSVLEPLTNLAPRALLSALGSAVLRCPQPCGYGLVTVAGLGVSVVLGSIFGLMYAASQQRIPRWALIAVGAFYGVLLWVLGRVLISPFLDDALRSILRSGSWLPATAFFGLWLGTVAAWVDRRRPAARVVVQLD